MTFPQNMTRTYSPVSKALFELELAADVKYLLVDPPQHMDVHDRIVFAVQPNGTRTSVIEKALDALTPEETKSNWKAVEAAIRKEVKSFVDLRTFEKLLRSQATNVMTSKWVLRWKVVENQRVIKARLTVRGFQDLAATELETFASTCSRWGQRIINSIVATHGWRLFSADVGTAFLQGVTFQELAELTGEPIREVSFVPPKGSEKYFQEHDPQLDFGRHVLRMLKPVYGLKDAPRCWRMRLDQMLRESP
jgi:hypothetical protein